MGAQIDSILKQCPPWVRVGMIAVFCIAVPLFGIMLAGRFYSGPIYVTGIVFALLLGVLTLLERVRKMGLPDDLAQVVDGYVEARTKFLDGGDGGKRFAWNALRTVIATVALGIVLSFEPRLASGLWWTILLTGGIAIGFSSVRAFVWALLVVSALSWLAAYFLIGVNFNNPDARDTFFIGWTAGTIVLSWNWIIAAVFAGPLMIAMSVGGSQSLEQARYLQGLRREESEFDAMIEARRARLRRARSQQANNADEIDVDEPLRRAESELRAQVNKSPAQDSNEPVRFPRPEDFLKRDGGEMLALEHRDPMRIVSTAEVDADEEDKSELPLAENDDAADAADEAEGAVQIDEAADEAEGEDDEGDDEDETAGDADERAPAEEGDVTDVSMPSQAVVTAPAEEMDDAAISRGRSDHFGGSGGQSG